MSDAELHILCTRSLDAALIQEAATKGISIDVVPFIKTEFIAAEELAASIKNLLSQSLTVIFTSTNAVLSVVRFINETKPDWKIYCIGQGTKDTVAKHFGEDAIKGTANYGKELAEIIINDKTVNNTVFFCGNIRRDELPETLKANQIPLQEIIVYATLPTPQKLSRSYNGVAFFSPSAVDSFFSMNNVTDRTILFAIGTTTATAIRKYSNNTISIAAEPSAAVLVHQIIKQLKPDILQAD